MRRKRQSRSKRNRRPKVICDYCDEAIEMTKGGSFTPHSFKGEPCRGVGNRVGNIHKPKDEITYKWRVLAFLKKQAKFLYTTSKIQGVSLQIPLDTVKKKI